MNDDKAKSFAQQEYIFLQKARFLDEESQQVFLFEYLDSQGEFRLQRHYHVKYKKKSH